MATLADILRQTGYTPDGTTPTDSPMTKVLAEHIKSIPQKFAQNQQAQMDLLGKAYPGNTYESMMTQGDPKALAELAMQAPFNAMVAYHGTPHNILGKFDISKVGTGEGAQAYGHGMYFAEAKPVAEQYAKELGAKIDVNGKPLMQQGKIVGSTGNTELDDFLVANLGDVKATRKDLLQSIKEVRPTNPEGAKDYQKLLAELRKSSVGTQNTGNLYKVDIPDEYIPNMLDWDKPLSAQPAIIEKLKSLGDVELSKLGINPDFTRRSTGKELTGESLYDVLTTHNSQKGASNLLAKLDIPGIRYLDQGSRPVAGGEIIDVFKTPEGWKSKIKVTNRNGIAFQVPSDMFTTSMLFKTEAEAKKWAEEKIGGGTSNFVVFDPSEVKILEKNNKPVSRKELIEEQVNKLKD